MGKSFYQEPAATAAFSRIKDAIPVLPRGSRMRAVVIGGGTGAPVSIRTLLSMGLETSAVVAMADDGGSTGLLREQAHVSPPGDVRKCLAAMAADPDDPMTRAFKYRFEFASNHTLGNLILSALEDATGSFPEAIATCERILNARGHVYPSTLDNVTLCGVTCDGTSIEGQAAISHSTTALSNVAFESFTPVTPYAPALDAIRAADLIVLGPGSLFTSIIPNLLVPGVTDAIRQSRGHTLFVCSLADQQGETWGMSAREHVQVLQNHGMRDLLDYVLVHTPRPLRPENARESAFEAVSGDPIPASGLTPSEEAGTIRPVPISYEDALAIGNSGPVVVARNLVDPSRPTWHDAVAMREAFTGVLKLCRSRRM